MRLSKVDGGFTITNDEGLTESKLPERLHIRAAYEVAKGNAFKRYSTHDFTVNSVKVKTAENVKLVSAKENQWILEVTSIPFKFTVSGFDENRDLKVKTS